MRIGYARVSTPDQSCALQCDALEQSGCTKMFQEVASGAKAARPALTAALEYLRAGDTLVVWRLDRLGRSLGQLMALMQVLQSRRWGSRVWWKPLTPRRPPANSFFRSWGPLRNSNGTSSGNAPAPGLRVRASGDVMEADRKRLMPRRLPWRSSSIRPRRTRCRVSVRASALPVERSIAT